MRLMYPCIFKYTKIHFLYPWRSCFFFLFLHSLFQIICCIIFRIFIMNCFYFFSIFHNETLFIFLGRQIFLWYSISIYEFFVFVHSSILYKTYCILVFWKKVLASSLFFIECVVELDEFEEIISFIWDFIFNR